MTEGRQTRHVPILFSCLYGGIEVLYGLLIYNISSQVFSFKMYYFSKQINEILLLW